MDQTGTLEELFLECGIKWQELEPGDIVDISHLNINIKSFNLKQEFSWERIRSLRRLQDAEGFSIQKNGIEVFQCNSHHRLLIHTGDQNEYISASQIWEQCLSTGYVLAVTGPGEKDIVEITCEKLNKIIPVLDIEVENTDCYLIDNLINHNTSGGEALKYYASQRMDVRRSGVVKDGDEIIANTTKVKVVKNKLSTPFKECEFQIRYGEGIDKYIDILNLAIEEGLVEKSGAWYSYEGTKIGQGEANVRIYMKENPDFFNLLWEKLNNKNSNKENKNKTESNIETTDMENEVK